VHLIFFLKNRRELWLILVATVIGILIDGLLIRVNVLETLDGSLVPPVWLMCLWLSFSLTLCHSLTWLWRSGWLAALAGSVAGPSSYGAGVALGAMHFGLSSGDIPWLEILIYGLIWAILLPVFARWSLWVEQPDRIEAEFFETEYDNSKYQMNIVLDHLRNRLGKESYDYLSPVTHVLRGVPSRELPAMARNIEADLVVMGTVARSGIAGVIIGNTAETVISELDCSVLVVKPEGFVSPVLPADD